MTKQVLIIGASHAAAQCIVSLRQGGYDGGITLLGDELSLPYHRPPLSKNFLSGTSNEEDLLLRPPGMYEDHGIDVRLGVRAMSIDRVQKSVTTDRAERLNYDRLVLATGARVRRLPVPGAELPGVFYLRSINDVTQIKSAIAPGRKAVIIGGGYIGLEAAASLTKLGVHVTVLEAMDRLLQRVTAPILADFYRRIHREEGVTLKEGTSATAIEKTDGQLSVHTTAGDIHQADLIIVGIGVIPNTELAQEAGLEVNDGIVVNEFCETSDPDIYAAGDVTRHYNPIYDTHLRLESVPNATEQAKIVANHINGTRTPYNSLPWFWSDQYDLKLQIAGLFGGYDTIVTRGSASTGRRFAAFYFVGDRLLAVDAVNSPQAFMFAKMMIPKGVLIDRAILGDPDSDLKACIIS